MAVGQYDGRMRTDFDDDVLVLQEERDRASLDGGHLLEPHVSDDIGAVNQVGVSCVRTAGREQQARCPSRAGRHSHPRRQRGLDP